MAGAMAGGTSRLDAAVSHSRFDQHLRNGAPFVDKATFDLPAIPSAFFRCSEEQ